MNLLRKENHFVTNVAQYAGDYRGITDGLGCWEIKDPTESPFREILEAVVGGMSQCSSIPRSALILIDVFLRGKCLDTSDVYVMLAGSTQRNRKTALKHIRRRCQLQQYPGLKLGHWDWPPQVPDITLMGGTLDNENKTMNLVYETARFELWEIGKRGEEEPSSDRTASCLTILAKNDGEELPRCGTITCALKLGGKDFLLAPAHIFMPRLSEEVGEDVGMEDSESDCGSDRLRIGSATPPDRTSESLNWENSENISGDITQASSSSSQFELEDNAQPPLLTPSNFKRGCFQIFSIDLDYVLIPIIDSLNFHGTLRSISSNDVGAISMGRSPISAATPSRGSLDGWLDGRPTFMRLPYAMNFTRVYPVQLSSPVTQGDCGSAVINRETNQICGFIVAASTEAMLAFIISADQILRDITVQSKKIGKEPASQTQGISQSSDPEVISQPQAIS